MSEIRKRTAAFVAEMDQVELAVRIIEAMIGITRPAGMSAAQALKISEFAEQSMRGALAAMRYLEECINAGQVPQ